MFTLEWHLITSRSELCIVKTAPPTKSRTYAPLKFRAEDGATPPPPALPGVTLTSTT